MIKPGNIKRARILIVDECADSAGLLADLLALHGYDGIHRTSSEVKPRLLMRAPATGSGLTPAFP